MCVLPHFNIIAALRDGRIAGHAMDVFFRRAGEPTIGGVDMANDVDGAIRAGSDVDVSRAGTDLEGGCSVHRKSLVKSSFCGEEGRGDKDENQNGGCETKLHRKSSAREYGRTRRLVPARLHFK